MCMVGSKWWYLHIFSGAVRGSTHLEMHSRTKMVVPPLETKLAHSWRPYGRNTEMVLVGTKWWALAMKMCIVGSNNNGGVCMLGPAYGDVYGEAECWFPRIEICCGTHQRYGVLHLAETCYGRIILWRLKHGGTHPWICVRLEPIAMCAWHGGPLPIEICIWWVLSILYGCGFRFQSSFFRVNLMTWIVNTHCWIFTWVRWNLFLVMNWTVQWMDNWTSPKCAMKQCLHLYRNVSCPSFTDRFSHIMPFDTDDLWWEWSTPLVMDSISIRCSEQ